MVKPGSTNTLRVELQPAEQISIPVSISNPKGQYKEGEKYGIEISGANFRNQQTSATYKNGELKFRLNITKENYNSGKMNLKVDVQGPGKEMQINKLKKKIAETKGEPRVKRETDGDVNVDINFEAKEKVYRVPSDYPVISRAVNQILETKDKTGTKEAEEETDQKAD